MSKGTAFNGPMEDAVPLVVLGFAIPALCQGGGDAPTFLSGSYQLATCGIQFSCY